MKHNQKQLLVQELKKVSNENKVPLWKRVALELEKPTRRQRVVNLSKLEKFATEKDIVIVPGKVLGDGELVKKLTVVAHMFSKKAIEKITALGGKVYLLENFLKENPKPKQAKLLG